MKKVQNLSNSRSLWSTFLPEENTRAPGLGATLPCKWPADISRRLVGNLVISKMRKFEKTILPVWFQRSPIDICPEEAYYCRFPAQSNPYPAEEYQGVLKGHHFELTPPLEVEVLGQQLRLVSIHFHAPSEHHLSGHQYPLELHMVHEIVKPTNGSTRFVIGVWFASQSSDDCRGAQFLKAVCAHTTDTKIDLSKCLPEDTGKFYRYEGSLTTGSYDEDVSWMVMHDPVPAPDHLLRQLKPEPDIAPTPVNRRYVLRSYPPT